MAGCIEGSADASRTEPVPSGSSNAQAMRAVRAGSTSIIYLAVIMLGIGSWLFTPKLISLPMGLVATQQKVVVVRGTLVIVSGTGMFLSRIVIGALRDATGTFVPGFLIFAVGAWFLFLAGII